MGNGSFFYCFYLFLFFYIFFYYRFATKRKAQCFGKPNFYFRQCVSGWEMEVEKIELLLAAVVGT
jgi:hypothetical protein